MKKLLYAIMIGGALYSCSNENKGSQPVYSITPTEEDLAANNASATLEADGTDVNLNYKGYELIKSSDCMSCHTIENKLVGPSFKAVAEKYSEKDSEMLSEKIINGGQGNWGEVPMLAHPQVSKEDARTMVEFVLSLKK